MFANVIAFIGTLIVLNEIVRSDLHFFIFCLLTDRIPKISTRIPSTPTRIPSTPTSKQAGQTPSWMATTERESRVG